MGLKQDDAAAVSGLTLEEDFEGASDFYETVSVNESGYISNFFAQMKALLYLRIVLMVKSPGVYAYLLLQPIILSLLYGLTTLGSDNVESQVFTSGDSVQFRSKFPKCKVYDTDYRGIFLCLLLFLIVCLYKCMRV